MITFEFRKSFLVTVPKRYKNQSYILRNLERCVPKEAQSFFIDDDRLTDKNYRNVTHKLFPGERFIVEVYECRGKGKPEEHLEFLKKKKAVLVGAQGCALVLEAAPHEIRYPEEDHVRWYYSLDRRQRLYDARVVAMPPDNRVPHISVYQGQFYLSTSNWDHEWAGDFLLCFLEAKKRRLYR